MMITAPLYFSKCPPLAAMHFTALAFMSNIALLTIAGMIAGSGQIGSWKASSLWKRD